ncbi:MAG: glycosyl transferase [Acidobacteriia bacterium]|nr:glycosyl transferase [Terriglobia bacterium]
MREEALRVAEGWEVARKRRQPVALLQKWQTVCGTIQRISSHLRAATPADSPLEDPDAKWLTDNFNLLKAALQEIRQAFKAIRKLPDVQADQRQTLKRAYAAAAAYLRSVEHAYEQKSLLTFVAALQEVHPFVIAEIWALKPMMQLVLLEEIAALAPALLDEVSPGNGGLNTPDHSPVSRLPCLINSLREVGQAEWNVIFENLSVAERTLREDPSGTYPLMDGESRTVFRRAVEELGASSPASELEVAQKAVALARAAHSEWSTDSRVGERRRHVGYYLIGKGRQLLEKQIRYRPPFLQVFGRVALEWPEVFYFVGLELLVFAAMAFVLGGVFTRVPLILGLILLVLPATEAAWGVMNQVVTFLLPPSALPKLDFSEGIPSECTTLVVVPTLLTDEGYALRMVRDLEVRYLANRDPNLHFALLTDLPDSPQPSDNREELAEFCRGLIEELNGKYAGKGQGSFFLFHRRRIFNPKEGTWMGWERKRGKLLDLNNLLRGQSDCFPVTAGDLSILPQVRYVITLDSDTELPRGTAHRLVGALAHPLNRAVIDPRTNTVVEGYGILQPRVGISVQAASRSLLSSIYSGQTGFDLYTRASSDVYQDLFGEGSFAGKGIYEVDVFRAVLAERFPSNAILSHDLIEGAYARSGLVTDVEVIDDYPSHFSAYSRRKHRWVRGDWQIARWLFPRVPDFRGQMVRNPLSLLSRWKILDNLRRSIIEFATFALFLAGWFSLPGNPLRWTVATLVLLLIPTYVHLILSLLRAWRVEHRRGYLQEVARTFVTAQVNTFFLLAFLSHQTLLTLDAIVRTVVRLTITRRKLLEWETAAQAEQAGTRTPIDSYLRWTPWLSLAIGGALALTHPLALPAASPLLVLWGCSNRLARWLNRPLRPARAQISAEDQEFLRSTALRTWRFFRQLGEEEGNGLVPDNIQESPPAVAHRISPTNLGLLLNAQLAAFELGYLTLPELVGEVDKTLSTAKSLARYKGHFLNWYDSRTLEPLTPRFVSTVDSGNLVCCLWTLKQVCRRLSGEPVLRTAMWRGLRDHVNLLEEIAAATRVSNQIARRIRQLSAWLDLLGVSDAAWIRVLPGLEESMFQIECSLAEESAPAEELRWWVSRTLERTRSARRMIEQFVPWLLPERYQLSRLIHPDLGAAARSLTLDSLPTALADLDGKLQEITGAMGAEASVRLAASFTRQMLPKSLAEAERLAGRLRELANELETLVQEMDFRFLYDPQRKVLSIGYDVSAGRQSASDYDLLASEARSAAFVAIAKGDIPQESWFRLGRGHVRWEREDVLHSWAGTMFEYLMPTLWLRNYPRTILDQSARAVVRCQQKWAAMNGIPWGVSEAAYSTRDLAGHYQYRSFGVPTLALRPSSWDDLVVAPYATFLALAVDPQGAVQNLRRMGRMNWRGAFGFFEAADFAPSRREGEEQYRLVRCWMAHHQGMSLLAVCNLLRDGAIQNLFHAEPAVAATELLLHEKLALAVRVEPAEVVPCRARDIRENGQWRTPRPWDFQGGYGYEH